MSQPLRITAPTTRLHLYRHLLREASYLPPFARHYVDRRIKHRFRHSHSGGTRSGVRALRMVRAANAGDLERMRRILYLCFGRTGQRRRELIDQFMRRPVVPADAEEVAKYAEEAAAAALPSRKKDWLDLWDIDKLRAFALSQASANLERSPRPTMRTKHLDMEQYTPKENIWGRTPAAKLTRSRLRNAWKAVANRILPPLPKQEWEQLRDLATSAKLEPQWISPGRRPVAHSLCGECKRVHRWNWHAYATRPVSVVDRQAGKKYKLLSGAIDDNTPTGDPQPINRHNYTFSLWKRLMRHIWSLSAFVEKKPDGSGWNIVWGKWQPHAFADTPAGEFFEIGSDIQEPAADLHSNRRRKRR